VLGHIFTQECYIVLIIIIIIIIIIRLRNIIIICLLINLIVYSDRPSNTETRLQKYRDGATEIQI